MAKETDYIVVNGEKMTIKAWKESVAAKQKERRGKKRFLKIETPKKVEKKEKEVSIMAQEIEKMMKPMTTLKSIQVYRNHAYRSWGTIANEILAHKGISKPMTIYCVKYGELNAIISEIKDMAKNNEKAAYQYVEKMVWKLDDMRGNIIDMIAAINSSGVCERFKNHEAIYGKGRQLGLETVAKKCLKTIEELEDIMNALKKIVDDGINPMNYGEHMSAKARARCWA